jgi:hypothetical protein
MIGVVKFDFGDWERKAAELSAAADQIPFALSRALNQAVDDARIVLIGSTWPGHIKQRNSTFMRAALRRRFATKSNLSAEIYDSLHRGHLKEHAIGGTKTAKGGHLTIPNEAEIPIGSHGIRKSDRASALIARTPKRALRITPRGIYVGKGGKLVLKYALRRSVPIPRDVPFQSDFETAVRESMRANFPFWIKKAMATRRAR